MAARWYNPATGSFTSRDTYSNSPTPNSAAANPFAYADGNPLGGIDPTGHNPTRGPDGGNYYAAGNAVAQAGQAAYALQQAQQAAADLQAVRDAAARSAAARAWYYSQVVAAARDAAVRQAAAAQAAADAQAQQDAINRTAEARRLFDSQQAQAARDAATRQAAAAQAAADAQAARDAAARVAAARRTFAAHAAATKASQPFVGPTYDPWVAYKNGLAVKAAADKAAADKAAAAAAVAAAMAKVSRLPSMKTVTQVGGLVIGGVAIAVGFAGCEFGTAGFGTPACVTGVVGAGEALSCATGVLCSYGGEVSATQALPRAAGKPAATRGCSFAPATAVLMADGTSKPILTIKEGDKVESADPTTGKDVGGRTVQKVWLNHDSNLVDVEISTESGNSAVLHTTDNHPFWDETTATWVPAGELKPGDRVNSTGDKHPVVLSVTATFGEADRYNLTVDQLHTYYVVAGDTPVLVHNTDGCGPEFLYHYTNKAGQDAIVDSGTLNPSLKALKPQDARLGDGQYLSDIEPGTKTCGQLARCFFGTPWGGQRFTNFVKIDVRGLGLVTDPTRPGVYLIPNSGPLDISSRIAGYGTNG
jgi:hypothetical protein